MIPWTSNICNNLASFCRIVMAIIVNSSNVTSEVMEAIRRWECFEMSEKKRFKHFKSK